MNYSQFSKNFKLSQYDKKEINLIPFKKNDDWECQEDFNKKYQRILSDYLIYDRK